MTPHEASRFVKLAAYIYVTTVRLDLRAFGGTLFPPQLEISTHNGRIVMDGVGGLRYGPSNQSHPVLQLMRALVVELSVIHHMVGCFRRAKFVRRSSSSRSLGKTRTASFIHQARDIGGLRAAREHGYIRPLGLERPQENHVAIAARLRYRDCAKRAVVRRMLLASRSLFSAARSRQTI